MRQTNVLLFHAVGCGIEIECRDARAWKLLVANYGHMRREKSRAPQPNLQYVVDGRGKSAGFSIWRRGRNPLVAADEGEFLFLLEKDLTIELQKLRCDLYFLHAAALEFTGKALLLVAASGQGKSTTAWGLLHYGFGYLSDELGPVDLLTMRVYPYPHALCLKKQPPRAYPLPEPTIRTLGTFHIPARYFPNAVVLEPTALAAIFLLEYCPTAKSSALDAISEGEAAARLFTHALNPLAHADDGLEGVLAIARKIRCFRLRSADLYSTCRLIREFTAFHIQSEPRPAFPVTPRAEDFRSVTIKQPA